MKKIWNWLNGKKTIIGLLLTTMAGQDFFQHWIQNPDILDAINWIGGILAGTGLLHKGVKATKSPLK